MAKNLNALQKSKKAAKEAEQSIANAPVKKKIGFFSAMMVVVGSAIGAGIFFKSQTVLNNSQSSIVFAMFAWLLAAFAVISMGLALIEIASARNDNLSMIGWVQTFSGRTIYKACKNYMFYVYLPLTYFFMPLYAIMSFQDGIASIYIQTGHIYNGMNTNADWAIMMMITVGVSIYFIVVCGLSAKAGSVQNLIITLFKFLPLAFAAILGFVIIGMLGHVAGSYQAGFAPSSVPTHVGNGISASDVAATWSFNTLTPGIGLFIAMGAIFFAYDGFYVTAGIQSDMKEPKKTPIAILLGLIIITVIYLIIAISMSLGSKNGNPYGFGGFLFGHKVPWIYSIFQILIGIGVLGIVNGFALWSTRFTEDLIKANEIPFSAKFISKIRNDGKAIVGIYYNLVLAVPLIILFSIIGGLGYIDFSGYTANSFADAQIIANTSPKMFGELIISAHNYLQSHPNFDFSTHNLLLSGTAINEKAAINEIYNHIYLNNKLLPDAQLKQYFSTLFNEGSILYSSSLVYNYGTGLPQLYSFCDLLSTWTSVYAFAFIVVAIAGGLKNRKTNNIKVNRSKFFVPMAIIVLVTMIPAIFLTFFTPIVNLFFLIRVPDLGPGQENNNFLIGTIMTVVVLFIYIFLTFGPTWIEDMIMKHKYGSVAEGEKQKLIVIATAKGLSPYAELLDALIIQKRVKLVKWEQELLGREKLTDEEIKQIEWQENES